MSIGTQQAFPVAPHVRGMTKLEFMAVTFTAAVLTGEPGCNTTVAAETGFKAARTLVRMLDKRADEEQSKS